MAKMIADLNDQLNDVIQYGVQATTNPTKW